MEAKARIIEEAREQFFKYGYSRMRMDDLAQSLGMSKKTLYLHFEGKKDLCEAVAENIFTDHKCGISLIMEEKDLDFISRLRKISIFISTHAMRMTNEILVDFKRNVPQIWKKVEEFRKKSIHNDFKQLIQKGIEEKVFRNDLNVDVVIAMYYGSINYIISPENLQNANYNSVEAFNTIFRIVMEGMMTEEARKEFENVFKTVA
jgi:AcrR family transcriptional regulator